jgi:hypothetical protein
MVHGNRFIAVAAENLLFFEADREKSVLVVSSLWLFAEEELVDLAYFLA